MATPPETTLPPWVETIRALNRPFITTVLTIGVVTLSIQGAMPYEFVAGAFTTIIGHVFGERAALKQPQQR